MKTYIELQTQGHTMRGYQQGDSDTVLVMLHGFTGNKTESRNLFKDIAEGVEENKIASLRFDWFGHGESDVSFEDLRVPLMQAQAQTILDYAQEHFKTVVLLGFSMGGFLAMDAVRDDVDKLILMAPAIHIDKMEKNIFKETDGMTRDLSGLTIHREFIRSFSQGRPLEHVKTFKNPVLILQGEDDSAVGKENSIWLNDQLNTSSIQLFKDAPHCFERKDFHDQLIDVITEFINS